MNSLYRARFCLLAVMMAIRTNATLANVAVQYHCAGGVQLTADAHLTTLHKVLALPLTTNMEDIALTSFSSLLTNILQPGNSPLSVSLIEPLLSDVIENESLGSFGARSSDSPSFILALHLQTSRLQVWQDNFAKIFGSTCEEIASQGFSGRSWNVAGSNSFWMIPAKGWMLIGRGGDYSAVQGEYLNQIRSQGRPVPALQGNWLEADISSSRVGGWFRLLKPAHIGVAVTTREDNLRISARVVEEEAIPWKSDPWRIPTDLMRGRIISLTVGQNVAAFLNVNPVLGHLSSNPLTNQFCFWALDQIPLLNYMAWPEADASNALERLSTEAPAALNPELKRFNGTELVWLPDARKLILQNIRLFVPILQAMQDNGVNYLFLSSFPRSSKSKPASDALLDQIRGRTNLVYYDWELTGYRLAEWQILSKMISNRSGGSNSDFLAAVFTESQWLNGLAGLVDNTVTEITVLAPNKLFIERKAPLGFTAVELVLLADWLCDANSGAIHSPPAVGNRAPLPIRP